MSWDELGPQFYAAWGFPHGRWMPEHLAIYGPTGSGKSHFQAAVLAERGRLRGSHIVLIATKPADATVRSLGWPIVDHWPPRKGWRDKRKTERVVFWPRARNLTRTAKIRQAMAIEDLLAKLWKPDSNIIVAFDEISYVEHDLGTTPGSDLKTMIPTYFREGRALGITVVASTQRPAYVTRYMHSESTWCVFFAPKDEDDAERMAQVAGNKNYYLRVFGELHRERHEFLLVHNLTNEAYISSLPKNGSVKMGGLAQEPDTRNVSPTAR